MGFFAILFTFSINLSIGLKARSLASFEKVKAPQVNTIHTKTVLPKLNPADTIFVDLVVKIPLKLAFLSEEAVFKSVSS